MIYFFANVFLSGYPACNSSICQETRDGCFCPFDNTTTEVVVISEPSLQNYNSTCTCGSNYIGPSCAGILIYFLLESNIYFAIIDLDECVNRPCTSTEYCTNTFGSYTCTECPATFESNGTHCVGKLNKENK